MLIRLLVAALVFALVACQPLALPAADDQPPAFNRDIRPILADKCFACHGPDEKKREAELRLDTHEGATADRDGVRAIVPGDLAKSALWERINSDEEFVVMPPPETKKTLTDTEKVLLKRWIEAGAAYQKHWAFEPIMRPAVPGGLSETENKSAAIDAFLNERIQAAGLTPQSHADPTTLLRRVSFALTGLPPTLEDLREFSEDGSSTTHHSPLTTHARYEAYVDKLLASPRYGEEMARHWLDVARYADTHGLHLDNERQMWAYRDWVVKAFNQNLPFDQFTIWQVAGDQLPNATTDQLVATGFNRCNVTTSEGGSINAEFEYRYAVDRAATVAQVWLGLTAGCAVCHDHKFDPLTAKDFYSLYAFFYSAADPAMDGNINVTPPFLKLPTPQQQAAAEAAGKVEREARAWLEAMVEHVEYVDPAAQPAETKEPPPRKPARDVLFDDAFPVGTTTKSSSRNAIDLVVDPPFGAAEGRRVLRQAFAANYTDTIEFKLRPLVVPHDGVLEVALRVEPLEVPQSVTLGAIGGKSVTWKPKDGKLVRDGAEGEQIVPGEWRKLAIPAAELGLKPGDKLSGLTLAQHGGIVYWDAIALVGSCDPAADPLESLAAWRKALGKTVPPELPGELNGVIQAGPEKELTDEEAAKLMRFYLAVIARDPDGDLAAARAAWETARTARIVAEESAPGTFIFRDLEKPRESFVMLRGQYDKPGEKVEPAVPAIFPQIDKPSADARLTRLDLANWLVADENPLTARVAANRLWQQFFGTGLVRTSDDFGTQGELPSHPELLDWLASELRDSNWDVKRFVKMLVMTEAFRRDSRLTPDMQSKDPQNRLLARGPRLRLDAEQIRDNVLYVSGLVDLTMGGRGVNPYQPPNIWEPVGYSDSNTRYYLQDHGPALYRRSLYVFLKRTAPPPFMSNFDGPNREQVCARRERSNTPLQALQLMNDTQHFEAARALAERVLASPLPENASADDEWLTLLYRLVLSRPPDSGEMTTLRSALSRQRELCQADPAAAARAIEVGESKPKRIAPDIETAAWTMVANLVLNLDETINRN